MGKCRRFVTVLLVCVFVCSCESRLARFPAPEKIVSLVSDWARRVRPPRADAPAAWGNSPTVHLDHADEELTRITETARDTLPDFYRHLLRPREGESGFCVKYPFRADSPSPFSMEQLWLEDIRFKDGVYYGIVANTPFYIASIKRGDTVSFNAGDVTDWMYISGGKIIGGRSVKYLLEQIAGHERSEEQRAVLKMFE